MSELDIRIRFKNTHPCQETGWLKIFAFCKTKLLQSPIPPKLLSALMSKTHLMKRIKIQRTDKIKSPQLFRKGVWERFWKRLIRRVNHITYFRKTGNENLLKVPVDAIKWFVNLYPVTIT